MSVEYLGTGGWQSSGDAKTPHASANYFLIGMMGTGSGAAGAQWNSVAWDGLSEAPQSADPINFVKKTTANSVFSALWELLDPDVSGEGQLTFDPSSGSRGCIMYFRYTNSGDPTFSETTATGTPDHETIDPGWIAGAIKACVVAHNGDSEAPASGFTEVAQYVGAAGHSAMGYRSDDGNVGWNVDNGDRGACCASCIKPILGGSKMILMMSKAYDRIQENRKRLGIGDLGNFGLKDGLWKPNKGLATI